MNEYMAKWKVSGAEWTDIGIEGTRQGQTIFMECVCLGKKSFSLPATNVTVNGNDKSSDNKSCSYCNHPLTSSRVLTFLWAHQRRNFFSSLLHQRRVQLVHEDGVTAHSPLYWPRLVWSWPELDVLSHLLGLGLQIRACGLKH